MIDFIKYELKNTNSDQLEANSLLQFHNKVNTKTGELGKYLNAYYKGLEFKIFESTKTNPHRRITLEGSLHKYWNNGSHNFNDFDITQINEVLNDLNIKFNIKPRNCYLKTLELGVNIQPPQKTKTILNNCVLHKTDRLKWIYTNDEGNYIQSKKQKHIIKIYDKRTHYKNKGFEIQNEIMRFEIKFSKMYELNNKGIYTIENLLHYGLDNFIPRLIKEWENVIFYDEVIFKGTKYEYQYSNPTYWKGLNYALLKYHRNNLKKLTENNPFSIKKKITKLIQKKAQFLNIQTTVITPLHILVKTVVSPFKKENKNSTENRRKCLVTGLNISMQKKDSILLSHTGLKYYLKTDKKVFKEVKRKYLTKNWSKANNQTQIKEIAHNIRNTLNNQRIKQDKLHPTHQNQLFKITL